MNCDFCYSSTEVASTHFADRFILPGDPAHHVADYVDTDGEWAACAICHQFLVDGDFAGLVAYGTKQIHAEFAAEQSHPDFVAADRQRLRMFNAFFENYHGRWEKDS